MVIKEFEYKTKVNDSNTAVAIGSGSLAVFATPSLAVLAEHTACLLLEDMLSSEDTTVGTVLNIKHLAPTPVGMEAVCKCVLIAIDGRKYTFQMEVFDDAGKIADVYHERFLVNGKAFTDKAYLRGK